MLFLKKCIIVIKNVYEREIMKRLFKFEFCFIFIVFSMLFFSINVIAENLKDKKISAENVAFEKWKIDFKRIALKNGLKSTFLDSVLPQLDYLPKVIQSDKKQSEFLLTFWDYTDRTITTKRIQTGKNLSKLHADLLTKTAEKYGVHPQVLMAFWGMETNYGTYKGNIDTLDALATLAFDKRRRSFFTNELITLLKLIQSGEKTTFKGSWAGAFGNFQFMPTTYYYYAVDADGDGQKDIINSLPDAFESAANYLSKMGWNDKQIWGKEVILTKKLNWKKIPENMRLSLQEWEKMGIFPACDKKWASDIDKSLLARLVLPNGIDGPAFLTFKNYDLIMRWNNSTMYALSVGILSDKIKHNTSLLCTKRDKKQISRSDIKYIQEKLKQKGLYTLEIDGILGKQTRKAIKKYQKSVGMDEDGYPSFKLLNKMKEK